MNNKIEILDNSVQLYGEWRDNVNNYNIIKSFGKNELTYKIQNNNIKFYATNDYFYRNCVFSLDLPIEINSITYSEVSAITEALDDIFLDEQYVDPSGHTIDLSDYYRKVEVDALLDDKQDALSAGTGISIDENNVISVTGGSGVTIDVDDHLDNTSENPVQNAVITYTIENISYDLAEKANKDDVFTRSEINTLVTNLQQQIDSLIDAVEGCCSGVTPTGETIYRWLATGTTTGCSGTTKIVTTNYKKQQSDDNGIIWTDVSPAQTSATTEETPQSTDCGYQGEYIFTGTSAVGDEAFEMYIWPSHITTEKISDGQWGLRHCCPLDDNIIRLFPSPSNEKVTSVSSTQYIDTSSASAMTFMFKDCSALTSVNLNSLNTSNVENMAWMFKNCGNLTTLDLSNFDTAKVTRMDGMFSHCTALTSIDLSSFDTSNVEKMTWMFNNCVNLTTLDLSNFDTAKVTDMYGMFYDCSALTSVNLSSFNNSNVEDMEQMFNNCGNLTTLDLSNFGTAKVTNMHGMFTNCGNLTTLDLSNFDTAKVTNMQWMFHNCSALTSVNLSSFNTSNVEDMSWMFINCKNLEILDLSNFDTSNVKDMSSMFSYCSALTSLDLSSFDTSNVEDMSSMFYNCTNLETIYCSSSNKQWIQERIAECGLTQNINYIIK